ncbi:MAG TPA: sugar nucleotide-binding protein [Trueperaceae bacterium]
MLVTGGTGRLGSELLPLLRRDTEVHAPGRGSLDVTDRASFVAAAMGASADVIVHAAAFTDVAGAERERDACWLVNVVGTRNAAAAARASGAKLVHVSTDYVFWGDSGGYAEDDTPGPVRNYYALTKLVAEEAARHAGRFLIVRTSFRPKEWPYPRAFTDLYSSQDYVDVIAPDIATVVANALAIEDEILHVATERKSVYELARRRAPDVQPASKAEAPVALPEDVSLDVGRWLRLRSELMARDSRG